MHYRKTLLISKFVLGFLIIGLSTYLLSSCANIVPPSGGQIDSIPPKLISQFPEDSSLNIKVNEIEMVFNKYMELGDMSQLSVSPQLDINPMIQARLKKVIITFPDSVLKDSTTYTIHLGDMLKDNREGTPYKNYTYTFSTGSYFDSLSIQGFTFSARTVTIDTSLKAVLYEEEGFNDSIVFKKKPMYVTPVDPTGKFTIKNLPDKNFRLFVFSDKDKNGVYDPGKDEIGMMDEVVRPSFMPDTTFTLRYFREEVDTSGSIWEDNSESSGRKPRSRRSNSGPQLGNDELYKVIVDTTKIEIGTQEINRPISILISPKVKNVNKEKIFLSFEQESVDIESILDIEIKDSVILLHTQWQEDRPYTLRLVKGWATDSSGAELAPGKYLFKSKKSADYGIVRMSFPAEFVAKDYLVQLYNGEDSISTKPIQDSVINFDFLSPGMYKVIVIKDEDKNGYWTTGDYIKKIQPEEVTIHQTQINVRPGWEMEETFKGSKVPVSGKTSMRNNNRSGTGNESNQPNTDNEMK